MLRYLLGERLCKEGRAYLIVQAANARVNGLLKLHCVGRRIIIVKVLTRCLTYVGLFLQRGRRFTTILRLIGNVNGDHAKLRNGREAINAPFGLALVQLVFLGAIYRSDLTNEDNRRVNARASSATQQRIRLGVCAFTNAFRLRRFAFAANRRVGRLTNVFFKGVSNGLFGEFTFRTIGLLRSCLQLPCLRLVPFAARNLGRCKGVGRTATKGGPLTIFLTLTRTGYGVLVRLLRRAIISITKDGGLAFLARRQEIVGNRRRARHEFVGNGEQRHFQVFMVTSHVSSFRSFSACRHASIAKERFLRLCATRAFRYVRFLSF